MVLKDQDTLDQNDLARLDRDGFARAGIGRIVVDGALDAVPGLQLLQVADHHVGVEGVRMIIVELAALLDGQLVIGPIVIIVAEHGDIVLKAGDQVLHQRCFAAAAAACDTQHNDI